METEDAEDAEFNSGERIYIGKSRRRINVAEHVARYHFAATQIRTGAVVLDAASGSGYGCEILSEVAGNVIGLEISDHALAHAAINHPSSKISYVKADLNQKLDVHDESIDAIISFETLEHIANQEALVGEFHRVLRRGGLLIISSPDRYVYSYLNGHRNQYHVHELTKKGFLDLLKRRFEVSELYGQSRWKGSRWRTVAKRELRRRLPPLAGMVKALRKTRQVSRTEPPSATVPEQSKLELITANSRSDHYYLVAVARKT